MAKSKRRDKERAVIPPAEKPLLNVRTGSESNPLTVHEAGAALLMDPRMKPILGWLFILLFLIVAAEILAFAISGAASFGWFVLAVVLSAPLSLLVLRVRDEMTRVTIGRTLSEFDDEIRVSRFIADLAALTGDPNIEIDSLLLFFREKVAAANAGNAFLEAIEARSFEIAGQKLRKLRESVSQGEQLVTALGEESLTVAVRRAPTLLNAEKKLLPDAERKLRQANREKDAAEKRAETLEAQGTGLRAQLESRSGEVEQLNLRIGAAETAAAETAAAHRSETRRLQAKVGKLRDRLRIKLMVLMPRIDEFVQLCDSPERVELRTTLARTSRRLEDVRQPFALALKLYEEGKLGLAADVIRAVDRRINL